MNNNNNSLIERYVYAVVKQLPNSQRKDIEQELRGLISDMLEVRCGELTPTETDIKVVLTELGTPSELAAKYDPAGERSLIGPKYFRQYIRVMPIVLGASALGVTIAGIIGAVMGEISGGWAVVFAEILSMIYNTLLSAFAIITIVFAVLEYKKVDLNNEDDLSRLPSVPSKKEKISRADCIVGIVINVILLSFFLFAPQFISAYVGVYSSSGGSTTIVPLFNVELIRSLWWAFVLSFGADIACNIYKLIIGRFNIKVAVVTAATSAITVIASAIILLRNNIMNPNLSEEISAAVGEVIPQEAARMINGVNVILFAIIAFAAVMGTITAFVKALSAQKEAAVN